MTRVVTSCQAGYGNPKARDRVAVAADIEAELITAERGKACVHHAMATARLKQKIGRVFQMEGYKDVRHYLKDARDSDGKVVIETGNKYG